MSHIVTYVHLSHACHVAVKKDLIMLTFIWEQLDCLSTLAAALQLSSLCDSAHQD